LERRTGGAFKDGMDAMDNNLATPAIEPGLSRTPPVVIPTDVSRLHFLNKELKINEVVVTYFNVIFDGLNDVRTSPKISVRRTGVRL
jgi:hypothetical protein